MIIVPDLIMGPGLFTCLITRGVLVEVSNAFSKVRGIIFQLYLELDDHYRTSLYP